MNRIFGWGKEPLRKARGTGWRNVTLSIQLSIRILWYYNNNNIWYHEVSGGRRQNKSACIRSEACRVHNEFYQSPIY